MEPTPAVKTSPKDFFLYMFGMGALYFCAATFVTLLWQLINYWLPVAGEFDYYAYDLMSGALRWPIALLVVLFPAYVVAMWWIGKDIDRAPEKRHIWIRRWFIYATLFLSAVTLLGDLVSLVYALLGGDIATRFLLKSLVIAIVAAAVFAYHFFLLRREPGTGLGIRKAITAIASVCVAAVIVAGFIVTGSPLHARQMRNDAQRVSDLESIQYQVTSFWQQKGRLPDAIGEVVDPANPIPLAVDPVTGAAYRYEKNGTTGFRLCATFEAGSGTSINRSPTYDPIKTQEAWDHEAGETCFDRTIDPDRYPLYDDRKPTLGPMNL